MRFHCYLLLLLFPLLLAGCRAERVAFRFQPVSVQQPVKAAHAALSELHSESRLLGSCTPQSLNGDRLTGGVQLRSRATFGVQLRKSRKSKVKQRILSLNSVSIPRKELRPRQDGQARIQKTAQRFPRPFVVGLMLLATGATLGVGGILLGAYLGGIGGFLIGFVSVLLGLVFSAFSLPAAISHDNGGPLPFNAATLLGYLLVALSISPLFGLSLALLSIPGTALLTLSLGLFIIIMSWQTNE